MDERLHNSGAVRQFTATAKDSAALFPPEARDITASCIRTQLAERPLTEIADVGSRYRRRANRSPTRSRIYWVR